MEENNKKKITSANLAEEVRTDGMEKRKMTAGATLLGKWIPFNQNVFRSVSPNVR